MLITILISDFSLHLQNPDHAAMQYISSLFNSISWICDSPGAPLSDMLLYNSLDKLGSCSQQKDDIYWKEPVVVWVSMAPCSLVYLNN